MVTAATIYMSLLGATGLERVAAQSHQNSTALVSRLCAIDGVDRRFKGVTFHETVVTLPKPAVEVLEGLAQQAIFGGYDLSHHYPELDSVLLICATETKTEADIARYGDAMTTVLRGA